MASTAAAVPAVGGTTPDISRRTNNPFFDKLFKRVDGLLCVLVSDVEGSLHAKAFNHRYRNPDNNYTLEGDKAHGNETSPPSPHDVEDELFDEDEVFIPDFDSTLPVTYQLASEQVCVYMYQLVYHFLCQAKLTNAATKTHSHTNTHTLAHTLI